MHDILISSPTLDTEKSNQYILSIQISLDGFSFSICDSISNKFIFLKHIPFSDNNNVLEHLNTIFNAEKLLGIPFKKACIAYDLKPSTLVPLVLFEENEKELYYTNNYKLESNDAVLLDQVKAQDAVNVYAIDENLLRALNKQFKEPNITHFNTLKIRFSKFDTNFPHAVLLSIRENKFSILVKNAQTVVLQNTYSYLNVDEFLYFFLYCFNQLDLDQHKTLLVIDGILPKHSSLIKQLTRYIKNIQFENWPESHNFANDFYDLPSHYFTYLYHNILCE